MEPWQQEVRRQFSDSSTFLSFDGLFCLFVELCWDWQTAGSRNRGSRSWGSSLTASFSGYEEHVFQLDELAGLSQCDLVPPVFCMWWIQFPMHSAHSIQVSAVAGVAGPLQTMILWKPTLVSPFLCSILFGVVCCLHQYMRWCICGHVFCGVSCRPVESVCFASCFYAIFDAFNSCVIIWKSYAIFQKYDDKLMSTFSRYTFEDAFPHAMILTWCVLGALNQLCRVSLSACRQSIVSQSWQNHWQRNQKTLFVYWLQEKTMLFAKHVINRGW